jgi:3'-phosphoadenosine 5'-phosphosulfate sulfotransferase (PAPS reductase)/FAD synthetase
MNTLTILRALADNAPRMHPWIHKNKARVLDVIGAIKDAPARHTLPMGDADLYIVGFSGGKDSIACALHLLECGVPRERIELWHHAIDPHGKPFMDWPCTPAYCQAVADALGLKLLFNGRIGGFEREMLRDNAYTAPVFFQRPDGSTMTTESAEDRAARVESKRAAEAAKREAAEAAQAAKDQAVMAGEIRMSDRQRQEYLKQMERRHEAAAAKARRATAEEEAKARFKLGLVDAVKQSAAQVEALEVERARAGRGTRVLTEAIQKAKAVARDAASALSKHERRESGEKGTRMKFPQATADLTQRWCSSYLKIDVAARVFTNDPRFKTGRFVLLTGERAQESAARANYPIWEQHRSYSDQRQVFQWRPVHGWPEEQVWEIIRRWGIVPHPAYQLGFGRVSCMACIFGNANQWATVQYLNPAMFEKIANYEEQFGITINRFRSVREMVSGGQAAAGKGSAPPGKITVPPGMDRLVTYSQQELDKWPLPVVVSPAAWRMPAGAFKKDGGPI